MTLRPVALAVALALSTGSAGAQPLDIAPEPYRRAALVGDVGRVVGSVRAAPRRPADPEQPLRGTTVMLLPRSAGFLRRLEDIRRDARAAPAAYRISATALRQAREAYELALWEAGYPDLARATSVDATGAFSLDDVPAGPWVLLASRPVFVDKPSPREPSRQLQAFSRDARMIGYYAVSVWVAQLTVERGRTETVELTDRGVWFTGIEEEHVRTPR